MKKQQNFWTRLSQPFTILAPMDGVTDVVFRNIIAHIGKPDVLFTEFTNCDGIVSAGAEKVMQRLQFTPKEHPVVAQIWGTHPDTFYASAKRIASLGLDGIDINMGCPHKTVLKDGACAALMKNHSLAKEIIDATKRGAGDIPVSVKTRLGFTHNEIDEWLKFLLSQQIQALTVHLRTVKELSKVPAHWECMKDIVSLRDTIAPQTFLIGNGDVRNLEEVAQLCQQTGCNGVMIGRGIFNNPWLFNKKESKQNKTEKEKLAVYLSHILLYEKIWGDTKNPAELKKFCKIYMNEFPNAAVYRERLMQTTNLNEMKQLVEQLLHQTN